MKWLTVASAVPCSQLQARIPHSPGKYAFFVDTPDSLPEIFRAEARTRRTPSLLYIGKADVSLFVRVWEQECQHLRPGTFFRSIGAMLGYRSPNGGKNYEFASADKARIVTWIMDHLQVSWDCRSQVGSHRDGERELIKQFAPLMNIQSNPRPFNPLKTLRALCRAGTA
jgi:hypothetical protein